MADAGDATRRFDRRAFLGGTAGTVAMAAAAGCAPSPEPVPGQLLPPVGAFPAGVSSGDPRPDRILLWTHAAPPPGGGSIEVDWVVATDPGLANVVRRGTATATAATDHTVKVRVDGLAAGGRYHYGFSSALGASRTGVARTAPDPADDSVEELRLAFGSCNDFTFGYGTALRGIAAENVDMMVWLGDYLYPPAGVRPVDPTVPGFLYQRRDPDWQAMCAASPVVWMCDDEVTNNYDRLTDPVAVENWFRTFLRYFPYESPDPVDPFRTWRRLEWGALADLHCLESRRFRDASIPAGPMPNSTGEGLVSADQGRSMMGAEQYQWLTSSLRASSRPWHVLCNQLMMMHWRVLDLEEPFWRLFFPDAPANHGIYANFDQWDGYAVERRRLLELFRDEVAGDVVVISGDTHLHFNGSLVVDPDAAWPERVAVEVLPGSLSAASAEGVLGGITPTTRALTDVANAAIIGQNPHIDYVNLLDHGYGVMTITPEETLIEIKLVDVSRPDAVPRTALRYRVRPGVHRLERLPLV